MKINTLKLHNFRNIEQTTLELSGAPIVVLYGENGAGKTSILEALSLLTPGRGLHRHKFDSHVNHKAESWTIFTELLSEEKHVVGMQFADRKRTIKIDDEKNKTQTSLSNLGNILWFTPKMDRLFMDSVSPRREFLDRLVFGHHKDHASNLNRLKHHLKNRLKLIKDQAASEWIGIEEEQAAIYAEKVSNARTMYLKELKPHLTEVTLQLSGTFEELTNKDISGIQKAFQTSRPKDYRAGVTTFGPQRSDVTGQLVQTNTPLAECSTGQHKRAILEILLANARLTHQNSGNAPIILLDEVAGHLDQKTKDYFLDEITKLGCQVWLTGTEKGAFSTLEEAQFIHIEKGQVVNI